MLTVPITEGGWLVSMPPVQTRLLQSMLDSGKTEEQVAELWLSGASTNSTVGFGAGGAIQNFYMNVKKEFLAFVCGDVRYEAERDQALQIWNNQGKVGLVSMVSAVVASTVSLAVAAVVPIIAFLFSLVAKVGVNAFCASCSAVTPPPAN